MADTSSSIVKAFLFYVVMMPFSVMAIADARIDSVEKTLLAALPGTTVVGVEESVIEGLYQVMTPDNVFYAESKGRYLVIGRIYDLYTGTDISADALKKSSGKKTLDVSIPELASLKFGAGESSVTVLFDPLCGYCVKLYRELLKVPDFSFALAIYPGDFRQDRVASIARLHCSPNPKQSLDALIRSPQFPDHRGQRGGSPECLTSATKKMNQLMQWVQRERLQGTPILISSDGRVSPGYKPIQEIMQWLNEGVAI